MNSGTTGTLLNVSGAGAVQSIKLDPDPHGSNILSGVRILMNWDGGPPEVDVPLSDFFGSGKNEINVASIPIGMTNNGNYYCYFPMPFWNSAEISLVNNSGESLTNLTYEIQYTTNLYDAADSGYFYASYRKNSFTNDGTDFNFIETAGRGHLVGLSLFMHGAGTNGYYGMGYLEGDERVYIDGKCSPDIHGTGNEDYFNAGWYFNQGTFSLPYHGAPYLSQFHPPTNYTQAYRFHLSDLIPFNQSVKFGIEHGHANDQPGTYASVVYYYMQTNPAPGILSTAEINVGSPTDETRYAYQTFPSALAVSNRWYYDGDQNSLLTSDDGYVISNRVQFRVPISENSGVILRRRTDQGTGIQKATVYIDNEFAGTWYLPDCTFSNTDKRWCDSEFAINRSLTGGKTGITVRIENRQSGAATWNEYHYWVYSVRPLKNAADVDGDQLLDQWEVRFFNSIGQSTPDADPDQDGMTTYEEYIAGTDPTNQQSCLVTRLTRTNAISRVQFMTSTGRIYSVSSCTNLTGNTWTVLQSGIPGDGTLLSVPVTNTAAKQFFRLQVYRP